MSGRRPIMPPPSPLPWIVPPLLAIPASWRPDAADVHPATSATTPMAAPSHTTHLFT